MEPFVIGSCLVACFVGLIVGAIASRKGGHDAGWQLGYERGCDSRDQHWEHSAIKQGFARYEQQLERDGMQTKFVWLESPAPAPKGYE